jgi:hypothetical protein
MLRVLITLFGTKKKELNFLPIILFIKTTPTEVRSAHISQQLSASYYYNNDIFGILFTHLLHVLCYS